MFLFCRWRFPLLSAKPTAGTGLWKLLFYSFWICISVFVICTAVTLLYLSLKEKHGGWQQKLAFPVIAAFWRDFLVSSFMCRRQSAAGYPYLNSPHTVSLADVNFYYSNISDSPTIEISGTDTDGRKETFAISREEFEKEKHFSIRRQNPAARRQ